MRTVSHHKGFTIFEALIYIALFAFIMGGGILSAYQIFEGSAQVQAMAEREAELNFVLRKFDWALNGATLLEPNSGSPISTTMQVLKDGKVYDFTTDGDVVTMTFDGDTYELSSPRLEISNLTFTLILGTPNVLEITMNVDGDEVGPITRFIR